MNNAKICVSVCSETVAGLAEQIERAAGIADIIEIRFDCLPPEELRIGEGPSSAVNAILSEYPNIEFLVTFRSFEEGGRRPYSNEERAQFWNADFTAEYVDFESDLAEGEFLCKWKSKIVSFHVDSTEDLPGSFETRTADILKIASPVLDCIDGLDVWKFLSTAESGGDFVPVIPIAMGESGKWTRILGPAFGSPLAYASLDTDSETARGQIPATDLRDVYRVQELDRSTEIYGVVGNPVANSASTFMHNAAFREQELNSVYVPFEVKDLTGFIERMVRSDTREIDWNIQGLSVTIPYKQQIISELDFVDKTAEAIGAVNTVRIVDNQLIGLNTDAEGFIEPLKNSFGSLKDVEVAVVGAGGAARACIYALKRQGASPRIFVRNPETAARVAEEFACQIDKLTHSDDLLESCVIAVNATPAGMIGDWENTTPITCSQMKNLQLVYDLVYNPYETLFLREAAKAGIPAISGLEMLVSQASKQYELWTGNKAPLRTMSRAALSRLV